MHTQYNIHVSHSHIISHIAFRFINNLQQMCWWVNGLVQRLELWSCTITTQVRFPARVGTFSAMIYPCCGLSCHKNITNYVNNDMALALLQYPDIQLAMTTQCFGIMILTYFIITKIK